LIKYSLTECRDHPGEWRVEGVNRETGEVCVAIFELSRAKERAEAYLAWVRAALMEGR